MTLHNILWDALDAQQAEAQQRRPRPTADDYVGRHRHDDDTPALSADPWTARAQRHILRLAGGAR